MTSSIFNMINPVLADGIGFISLFGDFAVDYPVWANIINVILMVIVGFLPIGLVMGFAALSVVAERKFAAFIQGRYGPNRVVVPWLEVIPFVGSTLRLMGLTQLAADGLKFLLKEEPTPKHVHKLWYILAPVVSLSPVLIVASVVPFGVFYFEGEASPLSPSNIGASLLFVLAFGSLGVFGPILAGWSSNNKYSIQGAIRATSQMISYELLFGLAVLPVIMMVAKNTENPLSLFQIGMYQSDNLWFVITCPISAFIYLIALFAETNRLPFDMAESETDLVSGYHTEYGSFKFGLFFVGEYGHIALGAAGFAVLFLGAWNPLPTLAWNPEWLWISPVLSLLTMIVKIAMTIFFFIWIRWTLPRFRYDQVMRLCWGRLLPLGLINLIFYIVFLQI